MTQAGSDLRTAGGPHHGRSRQTAGEHGRRGGFIGALSALLVRSEALRGYLLLSPALVFLLCLLVLPLAGILVLSLFTQNYVAIDTTLTFANYWKILKPGEGTYFLGVRFPFETPIFMILLAKSILMAVAATAAVIAMAYPMAYFLAFRVTHHKMLWLILITVPFWTSYLLRIFAWKIILGYNGVLNSGLLALGVIDQPLDFLLNNPTSVVIALTHAWLAFAILPIYVSLEKIDRSLIEAATDLGDNRLERFLRVTLPLSMPGVISAVLLVFIPTVGDYITPAQIGGTSGVMIGTLIQSQFGKANNWPLGAALSVFTMVSVTALACLFAWLAGGRRLRA
ncbi:MAG: ABC transporter permease [Rhizobiaceae bacterium]|nr:ABC transporter permease [Rhizobiaceae bacterium]